MFSFHAHIALRNARCLVIVLCTKDAKYSATSVSKETKLRERHLSRGLRFGGARPWELYFSYI